MGLKSSELTSSGLQSWREVRDVLLRFGPPAPGTEHVTLHRATGRITARPVPALRPLPLHTHAVMDGFALGSAPPGQFRLLPGAPEALAPGDAAIVASGQPVPAGTASVMLGAHARQEGEALHIDRGARRDNIRRAGEEMAQGDLLLRAHQKLDTRHLALAAAAGVQQIEVLSRPRLALLGLHHGAEALAHMPVLTAALDSPALALAVLGTVQPAHLAATLSQALARQALTIVVGESLGAEDGPLATVLAAAGCNVSLLRANLKPAKPLIAARMPEGGSVLGLSGTAYAVTVAAHLFLRPMLLQALGLAQDDPLQHATADFARSREPGRAEALPVIVRHDGPSRALAPAGRFGQLSALAAMDGFALVAAEATDIVPGQPLSYHPLLMPLV